MIVTELYVEGTCYRQYESRMGAIKSLVVCPAGTTGQIVDE